MKHSVKRCRAGVHLIISSDNSVPLSLPSEWFRQVAVMLAQDELFIPRNRSLLFSFELSSPGPCQILEQFEDAAGSQDKIRVEIAHLVTSLSYGAQSLLRTCLPPTRSSYPSFPYQAFQKRSAADCKPGAH